MELRELERELQGLAGEKTSSAVSADVPEVVRLRMDEAYGQLRSGKREQRSGSQTSGSQTRFRRKMKRAAGVAGAAAVSAALLLGSAFVSPVMAETLKRVPIVNSVISLMGDMGLRTAEQQGLVTSVDRRLTQGEVTINLSQTMYDGTRLVLVMNREGADPGGETLSDWWSIKTNKTDRIASNIEFLVGGKPLNTAWSVKSGSENPNALIVTMYDADRLGLPETFDLTVKMTIAKIGQTFEFEVPDVTRLSSAMELTSSEVRSLDGLTLSVKKLTLTPATASVVLRIEGENGMDYETMLDQLPDRYKLTGFLNLEYDLVDEQGTIQTMLSGHGQDEDGVGYQTINYMPFDKLPASLTVKPYLREGKNKTYLPELFITIPVEGPAGLGEPENAGAEQ
ncbi:DUF4179 domain-containing protein [Paenibacillus sp. CN-4]|uniref:DUF4179 domain-containing protein n=1 Tax=Paenibacillus nanchangensis TaxID=3348343 RepID=UPI00397AAA37